MTGTSTVVGGVVPGFSSLFFQDLMQALADQLDRRGLRLMVTQASDERSFHEALGDFAARRARGTVAVPPADGLQLRGDATDMPVATLTIPCRGRNARFVSPDELRTGRTATKLLIERGHRRIAHLTYARRAHAIDARADGYRMVMAEAGSEPLVLTSPDAAAIVGAARSGVTAFFCHNDWLALAAIRALSEAGLSVPRDVSVLGVDASPSFTAIYPGISSLRYPTGELAAIAAAIVGGEAAPRAMPECELVPGSTVAPPPA
jgi:LacI family transcriptional regulator